jgi:hypothetical protein
MNVLSRHPKRTDPGRHGKRKLDELRGTQADGRLRQDTEVNGNCGETQQGMFRCWRCGVWSGQKPGGKRNANHGMTRRGFVAAGFSPLNGTTLGRLFARD